MADAHALLSQTHWKGADLDELVRRQIAPYGTDANSTISGRNLTLAVPELGVAADD